MSKLKEELAADPLSRGYANMTAMEVAIDINTMYRTRLNSLSTRDLLRWGFAREGLSKLADAAERQGAYANITHTNRAKALSAYSIMTKGIEGSLDLADSVVDALLDQLITFDIFQTVDKSDLQAMATESISRATELGLSRVREGTVNQARA